MAWVGPRGRRAGRGRAGRRRRPGGAAGLRRQPQPPGLRRRPGPGVRRPDGGGELRRRRHPHHGRRDPGRHRRAADQPRGPARRGDAGAGHHHRRDQERLRAQRPRTRRAASRWPASSPRRRRSSARTWCRRASTPEEYVDAGHRPDAGRGGAVRALGRRLLRARCLRRRPGAGRPARRALPAVCAGACTPTSSARDPAYAWPRSSAWSRSTTAPTSTTPTSTRCGSRARSRRCCRAWSSPPGSRTRTRAGSSTPACAVALASDCNPGSCFTSSLPLCIALAVREMGMTPAEAVHAATFRGARALRPRRRRARWSRAAGPT